MKKFVFPILILLFGASVNMAMGQDVSPVDEEKVGMEFYTDAPNWVVHVSTSNSETDCQDFRKIVDLFYDAQLHSGGLFGALQKLNPMKYEEKISATVDMPVGKVFQIRASLFTDNARAYLSCKPIEVKIVPERGVNYFARVTLNDGRCLLQISEKKDDGTKTPVQSVVPMFCK